MPSSFLLHLGGFFFSFSLQTCCVRVIVMWMVDTICGPVMDRSLLWWLLGLPGRRWMKNSSIYTMKSAVDETAHMHVAFFVFFPFCCWRLQPTSESATLSPSISRAWPLCTSDIDLSLPSLLPVACLTVSEVVLCVTKDGFSAITYTNPCRLPCPHTLNVIHQHSPGPAASQSVSQSRFDRLTVELLTFFCSISIACDQ